MALIKNTDKNIQLSLKLLNNKFLEIKESSHESWIPFALKLDVDGDCYEYEAKRGAVFTLYEINRLIGELEKNLGTKEAVNTFEEIEFYSSQAYFGMIFIDPLEADLVEVEFWFNMDVLSQSETKGYDQGYRFAVEVTDLKSFIAEIKHELKEILIKEG
ncbi:hypothetical protein CYV26_09775 [Carnobacterium maltaromaticum]|uniref:WapI family immunity protein n=1 Tax=Carnobacterium maltaromaticum TaxID=2751 RepID=UPI000C784065|nr:hypothetical protein [Carnobacterium maltaromaticum]PLS34707.1 hypothetical protein CYV33_09765 [Carnobacterium maltaromaticum]PLS36525.1 hypothetical protein CYV30_07400 [Carnobacterium maltaromaticum]PLS37340.1 hypothetical protein CYV31_07405 [Carnobacterium maltaromaticum]PLS43556.1 hypothetical protein CYV28_07410 [Carnobacterium maltaromaticum]PLS43901.1 hypothetical protein CYV27_09765 [Carnobacterium maltaromaticum]